MNYILIIIIIFKRNILILGSVVQPVLILQTYTVHCYIHTRKTHRYIHSGMYLVGGGQSLQKPYFQYQK